MQTIVENLIRECGCDPADFADIVPDLKAAPKDFLPASTAGQVIARLAKAGKPNNPRSHVASDRPNSWRFNRYEFPEKFSLEGANPGEFFWLNCQPGGARQWLVAVAAGEQSYLPLLFVPHPFPFAAAAEVCPDAALAGKCPGVKPSKFREFLAAQHAAV